METLRGHCDNKGAFGDLDGPYDWTVDCDIVESLMNGMDLWYGEDMKSWNTVDMSNFSDSVAPEDMCLVWETADDGDCRD